MKFIIKYTLYLLLFFLASINTYAAGIKILETVNKSYFQLNFGPPIYLFKDMIIPVRTLLTTTHNSSVVVEFPSQVQSYVYRKSQVLLKNTEIELLTGRAHIKNSKEKKIDFKVTLGKTKIQCKSNDFLINLNEQCYGIAVLEGNCVAQELGKKISIEKNQILLIENNIDKLISFDEDQKDHYIKKTFQDWYVLRSSFSKFDNSVIAENNEKKSWEKMLDSFNEQTKTKYLSSHIKHQVVEKKKKSIKNIFQEKCEKKKICIVADLENYRGSLIEHCKEWKTIFDNITCVQGRK